MTLTEHLTVWELWYFKAVTSYRGKRFHVPTRQTSEYNVDLTRHPKFPLAFGERSFPTLHMQGEIKKMWSYIFGNTFTFCTDIPFAAHFNCAEKKSMTIVQIFLGYLCLKHISYFHNILWLGTDAATSFLPLYLLLSPSRNYLFCNHHPPRGRGDGG